MPIISKVEARSPRGMVKFALLLLLLSLGGMTMIYPFVVMVSGSLRSEMDEADLDLVPDYLSNDQVLLRKFLETKYNQDVSLLNRAHGELNFSFRKAAVPGAAKPGQLADLQAFLGEVEMPRHWQVLGGAEGIKTVPENLRALAQQVRRQFHGDLHAFSRDIGAPVSSWNLSTFRTPDWLSQRYDYEDHSLHRAYFDMMATAPWAERRLVSISGLFVESMLLPVYGRGDVAAYNEAHAVPIAAYEHFVVSRRAPGQDQPLLRREWVEMAQRELNPAFIQLVDVPDTDYRDYLRDQYGTIAELNLNWGSELPNFEAISLPRNEWLKGTARGDYQAYLRDQDPDRYLLVGPEFAWRDWLQQRYGSLAALNVAHETSYSSFERVPVPMAQLELDYVATHRGSLRRTYAARNFVNVYDALFIRGHAFLNTAIFCALSIIIALLINPLAAYAMSRFRLPGTYKFLLLLMATMSFPPMVTMIPTFIMLRELNLLNSFLALVLPGAANGYMIFLLKGFFDSLPQDLYDAATIDGASEMRMFWQITMALSKPILAVVALGAFNSAYLTFLYALIVCPSEDMWLLSVWLFQYQQTASLSAVFASVLVAAIPPLLVFIFAQNIIMRGIVVPVEK